MSVLSGQRTPTTRLSCLCKPLSWLLKYSAEVVPSLQRSSDLRTTILYFSFWRTYSTRSKCQSLKPLVLNLLKFSSFVRASRLLTRSIRNSWIPSMPSKKSKMKWTVQIKSHHWRNFLRQRETGRVMVSALACFIRRLISLISLNVQTLIHSYLHTTR